MQRTHVMMVSALDSGYSCPGFSPGRGTALCSWERHLTPTVPSFQPRYILANLLLGGNPAMDWNPIQLETHSVGK